MGMIGAYGPWFSQVVLGDGPAALAFRGGLWPSVEAWREEVLPKVLDRLGPVDLGGLPRVTVESEHEWEGLHVEHLSWQLPVGPRTEAVFLRPSEFDGPLPGILGLHDHGGNKYLGWRKIVQTGETPWAVQWTHQESYYGGVGWATELARRGYAVLVHDTFPFGSRRVRLADLPPEVRYGGTDPEPDDLEGIARYNRCAAEHEHIMAKCLFSAGTTWPGVYLVEDQRALDVLCKRQEVDRFRVGCGGLSGGGMRTAFLAGVDERIACAVSVGFMTTWRDFLQDKAFTHTWMAYVPRLPNDLDFPEILGLRAPRPTMVQSCTEDDLFTLEEMQRADRILQDTYDTAHALDRYAGRFYPGGHKFDREMQADAFAWFDRWLR